MNDFFLYILKCADGSYYAGHTDDLERRLSEHTTGVYPDGYTSSRLPIELVFVEKFPSRDEALMRERQIKGWSRKKKDALIRGDFEFLTTYSNKKKLSAAITLRQAQGERNNRKTKNNLSTPAPITKHTK